MEIVQSLLLVLEVERWKVSESSHQISPPPITFPTRIKVRAWANLKR
jgi:hypothetical protein